MFKISLDGLLILDAIDRLGSFASAGNELHKVPSTISYSVAKLEQDLGVQLYERSGPKVELTIAGMELLSEGRYLLKAAVDLENRVRRVASGWETELTICMDSIFPLRSLTGDIQEFYKIADKTRLRIIKESLSGTWEALLDGRADILIGAAGEGPSGGGYNSAVIGFMEFVFAVSPGHPLAKIDKLLGKEDLHPYKAITVSDSVRKMAPRTIGLLFGQDTLAVPDMHTKLDYQIAGLGFGFLPKPFAIQALNQGLLVEKQVKEPRQPEAISLVWRTSESGQAAKWWIKQMKHPGIFEKMCVDIQ
ncbi:LysR substrate-binding domain-containing protein [Methyloradius palustris]|uniref:Transcriptional regulator n=1 Tax=Methyloradius palustris TaxID=2778876 RepID=A0A8D5FY65_9PROT|nr:LysR substrate-binding domain-containing protein [Methyloradius palustris]BCM24304.1 transcriptional regulator [Methyloradius palustris]